LGVPKELLIPAATKRLAALQDYLKGETEKDLLCNIAYCKYGNVFFHKN